MNEPMNRSRRRRRPGMIISLLRGYMRAIAAVAALLVVAGCNVNLYSHLSERDANDVMAVLLNHGISVDSVIDKDKTITVRVDKSQFAQAVTLLDEMGLPPQKFASIADVFPADTLISSPLQERARLNYALSQELSHTISEIDGVLSARVHIVMPDADELQRQPTPASASVFIRYAPSTSVDSFIPQIKTLVANSVAGVTYDKVTVVPVAATDMAKDFPAMPQSSDRGAFAATDFTPLTIYLALGALGIAIAGGLSAALRRRARHSQTSIKLDPA